MPSVETLVMQNDLKEIHRMTDFIENFGQRHDFPERDVHALTLSIEELITNTIRHGYADQSSHELGLSLSFDDAVCKVVIRDGAPAFNPFQRSDVDTSLSLEEKPIGGLGIHLVKKMMDRVHYQHRNGQNIITLHKQIGRSPNALPT